MYSVTGELLKKEDFDKAFEEITKSDLFVRRTPLLQAKSEKYNG